MKFSPPRFQGLRWQLAFSYARSITLSGICLFLLVTIGAFSVTNLIMPYLLLLTAKDYAAKAVPFFAHDGRADPLVLRAWLEMPDDALNYQPASITVIDHQGTVLASIGPRALPAGSALRDRFSTQVAASVSTVLVGTSDGLVEPAPRNAMILIAPIKGPQHSIYGAIVMDTGPDIRLRENQYWGRLYLVAYIPASLAIYILLGMIMGLIGGFGTARKFIIRFNHLARAAGMWSQGDFSTAIDDSSGDELGQLARQLNGMAEQLQRLLRTRQQLATLEERNRLARDLHDSIKQQVFAVSMQISTTRALLDAGNAEARMQARERIGEAEHLIRQAQKELTALIRELRPVALEGKELSRALEDMLADWSRRTAIAADFQTTAVPSLPSPVEEALYLVAREALANVARHSGASHVQVGLSVDSDVVSLTISDNGCGFAINDLRERGVGLHSMQERMQALGGSVKIESTLMKGTTVCARYSPIPATVA